MEKDKNQSEKNKIRLEKDKNQSEKDKIRSEKDKNQMEKDRNQTEKNKNQSEKDKNQSEKAFFGLVFAIVPQSLFVIITKSFATIHKVQYTPCKLCGKPNNFRN